MSTAHNSAEMGDIAKIVLMPGDPLRAKFIAETLLENPVQFNTVRNMFGYTGTYKGKKVSVMGSGMGIPSIGIYSYELFKFYGVETIIRIGSTGAYTDDYLQLYDTMLVTASYSESSFGYYQSGDTEKLQFPDEKLCDDLRACAKKLNIELKEGRCFSSDTFYFEDNMMPACMKAAQENNLLVAEMESFGLFHTAKVLGKKAACLLSVSDILSTHQETTSEERRSSFTNMMKVALEYASEQ